MKKFFFDTEFTGLHKNTTLISLGIVSDCGKTFYAELTNYDKSQVDDWIEKNVIWNLILDHYVPGEVFDNDGHMRYKGHLYVKELLVVWLEQFKLTEKDRAQFWGDVPAYDWVLFQSLFGSAFDMPRTIHYIPMDVATLFKIKGFDPDFTREDFAYGVKADTIGTKHNALFDAQTTKACHDKLILMPDAKQQ